MKRLSLRQKLRLVRTSNRRMRRRIPRELRTIRSRRAPVKAKHARPNASEVGKKLLNSARKGLPRPELRRGLFYTGPDCPGRRANLIMAPERLAVTRNYSEVLGFIYEQRYRYYVENPPVGGGRSRLPVVDLEKVREVDLGGMTALVAEYQRQIIQNDEFRPYINDEHWDHELRLLLHDFGFYALVRALNPPSSADSSSGMACVPFKAYDKVDGSQVDPLIEELAGIAGRAPKRVATYNALIEATKNVKNHAYPADLFTARADPAVGLWWAAGAYFREDDVLEFVVYDQGVGIPSTLKRKPLFETVLAFCPPELTDADVMAGAIELGRTSTGRLERGNGLWTICRLVEELPGSQVRLISGKGDVAFRSDGTVTKRLNANPFCGTLVHWKLALPTEPEPGVRT